MCVCVRIIRQLIASRERLSASEGIFRRLSRYYDPNIKPENDQPHEALRIDFGLAVQCAKLDLSDGLLKTYLWQFMVRKASGV